MKLGGIVVLALLGSISAQREAPTPPQRPPREAREEREEAQQGLGGVQVGRQDTGGML